MPLQFEHTNWNLLTRATIPQSANPVFLCCSGVEGPSLVVKFAPGVERIRFANTVFERMRMTPSRTRYVERSDSELATIFAALDRVCPPHDPKLEKAKTELGYGVMVMELTPGQKWEDVTGIENEQEILRHYTDNLLKPSIRQDMARLIAADLLLGNFDRISFLHRVSTGAEIGKIHGGNFFYAELEGVAHLLPLDNDTVQPSKSHLPRAATPGDFYRAVIEGAMLDDPNGVFPENTQSSMDMLLGHDAAQVIAKIFLFFFRQSTVPQAKDVNTFLPFAQQMVPYVREALREILGFRKDTPATPTQGTTQGLNTIMKAYRNIEGMNYDVFKVRCRFAELMTAAEGGVTAKTETDANVGRAVAYGKYRDWKEQYLHCLEMPTVYAIPLAAPAPGMKKMEKAERKLKTWFRAEDPTELAQRLEAHAAKKMVRKGVADEAELRDEWDRIKNLPDTDRSVVKAKILLIAELLRMDIETRFRVFEEIRRMATAGDWVARFYCRCIRKRARQVINVRNAFSGQLRAIKSRLVMSGDRSQLVGELETAYTALDGVVNAIVVLANT